jgi:hypothetical protein
VRRAGLRAGARLRPGSTPVEIEELLDESIEIPLRGAPRITLEEVDGDEVVVRISATPRDPADGGRLASEVCSTRSRRRSRIRADKTWGFRVAGG